MLAKKATVATGRVVKLNALASSRSLSGISPFGNFSFGPKGRSANSGITATVFGGYGAIGRYLVEELGSRGSRVYLPFRGCELEVRHLKPMFDLGQLGLIPFNARDKESITATLLHTDVAINMIGKHYETKHLVPTRREDGALSRVNYSFDDVHVKAARSVALAAKEAGVKCFIHISALAADPDSSSQWARSKAAGEAAVREVFPEAIIVRPATIFGPEDRFLNWMAEACVRLPVFPLFNGGTALVQPIHSIDVGKALNTIIDNYAKYQGRTFELSGPSEYSYKELAEFVQDVTTLKKPLVDVSANSMMVKLLLKGVEMFPNPVLTADQVALYTEDVLPSPAGTLAPAGVFEPAWVDDEDEEEEIDQATEKQILTMEDLDIEPCSVDKVAFEFLHRFRPGGHFTLVEGYH